MSVSSSTCVANLILEICMKHETIYMLKNPHNMLKLQYTPFIFARTGDNFISSSA